VIQLSIDKIYGGGISVGNPNSKPMAAAVAWLNITTGDEPISLMYLGREF
jgi:hypothetical protein